MLGACSGPGRNGTGFFPHIFLSLPLEVPQLHPVLPHELLHDLLHPHLQSQEADAIVPPEAEEVQQVPVSLLQHKVLPAEDGAPAHYLTPVFQPCRDKAEPLRSPSEGPPGERAGPEAEIRGLPEGRRGTGSADGNMDTAVCSPVLFAHNRKQIHWGSVGPG